MSFFSVQAKMKFQRFRSIKRAWYSFLILFVLIIASLFGELFVNNRALVVKHEKKLYFPSYGSIIPGKIFGLDYEYETNYRDLKKKQPSTLVILPLIPFGEYETHHYPELGGAPYPPKLSLYRPNELFCQRFLEYLVSGKDQARIDQAKFDRLMESTSDCQEFVSYHPRYQKFLDSYHHHFGTDRLGRDIVARLFYGFRVSMLFSIFLLFCTYLIGVSLGLCMGYFGAWFDLIFQRIIEIWSNVPFFFVVMIISSILVPDFWTLVLIMLIFGWMGMTWYMRTAAYKEREREYVMAAKTLGASHGRIIFFHILPNTISIVITFAPFAVASSITSLTALDYLGFGLPDPTPSWGELLRQGTSNLESKWIVYSATFAMIAVLTMVTFVGEALREAFDSKKFTYYR